MRGFTGIKDLDSELMLHMEDREFIVTCKLNKYFYEICKDDYLFKKKLELVYPQLVTNSSLQKYKLESSWRQYYSDVIKTIGLLKEGWNITYTQGDPFLQKSLLIQSGGNLNIILYFGIVYNEIDVVNYALNKGAKLTDSEMITALSQQAKFQK